jgi:hypothetical protein
VTLPVTPVDGNPPVNVADKVAELPTAIGELTEVVMVAVALLTVTGAVPEEVLWVASGLYFAVRL